MHRMKHFDDYSGTQNTWESLRCPNIHIHRLHVALVHRGSRFNPMDTIKSLYYSQCGTDHVFVMVGDHYQQTAILQHREDLDAHQISEN